jgi:hypothetical protein
MSALPPVGSPALDFTLPCTAGIYPAGMVRWTLAQDTPGARRHDHELPAQLEARRRSA